MAKANNKCRVCGYKFKKGDSMICPECFTSREETATCDDFSSDLHSHEKVSTSYQSYRSYNEAPKSDVQKQLELERQQSYEQQRRITERAEAQKKAQTSSSRLTDTQRQKLEAYYNSRNSSSTPTLGQGYQPVSQTPPPMTIYNTPSRNQSSRGAKGTTNPGKVIAIIIIAIVLFNLITGILGAVFIGNHSNSGSDYSYNYSYDLSFNKDIYSKNYSDTIEFGDMIYMGSGETVVDLPKVVNRDPVEVYPFYKNKIEGAEDYDGNWYLLNIPVSITNTGDHAYYASFDAMLVSSIYESDDSHYDIYSENLDISVYIIESGETKEFNLVYAIPEGDEQFLVLSFMNGLDTYEYTYVLPVIDFESLTAERQDGNGWLTTGDMSYDE